MPAKSKAELLTITEQEFAKLHEVIYSIAEETALAKDNEDTIKDVIAHRAHWIDLFLGWYADGRAGKIVHFPAEGYKWNDLKRYNADLRSRQTGLSSDEARRLLADRHRALFSFIQEHTDAELYGEPMAGGRTIG